MRPARPNPSKIGPKSRSKPKPQSSRHVRRRRAARAGTAPPAPSAKELRDALETLYQGLSSAYWSAASTDAKGRLRGAADAIGEIQGNFNIIAIEAETAEYVSLKTALLPVKARLVSLRTDIESLISVVSVSAMASKAIDSALTLISGL